MIQGGLNNIQNIVGTSNLASNSDSTNGFAVAFDAKTNSMRLYLNGAAITGGAYGTSDGKTGTITNNTGLWTEVKSGLPRERARIGYSARGAAAPMTNFSTGTSTRWCCSSTVARAPRSATTSECPCTVSIFNSV